ncbi:MAG: iron uptake porin [Mojavia pulchra JT2-VF2]|jgi:hypothetical protein|uniref:Iron uptake porin n=1 Tax=Mojavia pulchra JT2-VF2 TaxID=287848 RepID=A0A951PXZ1_9NOST|nr:iron uptake porin [Mojavia pulchra JT2-VF2]
MNVSRKGKNILRLCKSLAALGAILLLSNSSLAAETENDEKSLFHALKNTTSVSQLSDIKFTDWSFQTLQSLGKRYGCNVDFHSLYKGNSILTRHAFAIALNTCLLQLNQLINADKAVVNQDDLETLNRLQREFATELASWQRRVDTLEVQTAQLQAQQFAPTTKLTGEAIFAVTGAFGGKKSDRNTKPIDNNIVLHNRVRLNFDSSFSGKDRLRVRLQAANISSLEKATGTDMARLGFESDNENDLKISRLEYSFPVGKQARASIGAIGSELSDFADTVNPFFISSSRGAISRFGRYNPIYRQSTGTGIGIDYALSKDVNFSFGYIADNANNPRVGISKSPYGAIFQLTLKPVDNSKIGLTYVRSYNNLNTGTGSELANDPFNDRSDSITANSYGIETSLRLSRRLTIGGWVGLTKATAEDITGKPSASIFNYAITLAFPDLGKKGNLAGIIIGQPPKVISNDFAKKYQDEATSWHLEFLYRFQVNENIAITPGLLIATNPEHKHNSDTVYVGTIRTTFSF